MKLIADQKAELERLKLQLEQSLPSPTLPEEQEQELQEPANSMMGLLKDKEEQLTLRDKEIEALREQLDVLVEEKEAQLEEKKRIMDEKEPQIEQVAKQLELLKLEVNIRPLDVLFIDFNIFLTELGCCQSTRF